MLKKKKKDNWCKFLSISKIDKNKVTYLLSWSQLKSWEQRTNRVKYDMIENILQA